MRKSDRGPLYQDLDRLFRSGTVSSGDGALLDSFLTEGNEAAFEALVNRHGPMVRGVCRRLLRSPHDADDAFQATFLVLVRKGGRLRDPDRLGPWLHGVATRVAGKARASRRNHEAIVDVPAREDGSAEWSDVMPIIDAELARMSSRHRDVLIACLVEGATAEEASRQLACPVGTVKSRLARARETLRARLTSRGVVPARALAALETTDVFAFASPVSSTLIRATLKTVTSETVAPGVAALTEGVASVMISKFTITVVAAVGFGLTGIGAAAWLKPTLAQDQPPKAQPRAEAPAAAPKPLPSPAVVRNRRINAILVAASNYLVMDGGFPPPAITDDGGKPLLSWRVALLPFLKKHDLYKQFHLTEPWDSPHNKALIDRMPDVFETPDSPAPKGQTRIQGFTGKGAIFDPTLTTDDGKPRGVGFKEVKDSTINTVLLALARDPAVWTKPQDLPFVLGQDLPALDETDPQGYVLGMSFGAIRLLKKGPPVPTAALTALITRAGGEVIDPDLFTSPPPMLQPLVEKRLQKIEEKLDRLLEKLDAK